MQNGKRCGSQIRAVKTGGARRKGVRWTEERRLGQGSGQMTVTNFRRSAKGKDEAVKGHQPPSFIGCMCHQTSHFSCVLNTYNTTYMRVDVTLSPTMSKVLIGIGTGRLASHVREAGRAPKAGTTQTHSIPFATKS
jgi:hypothetical protein